MRFFPDAVRALVLLVLLGAIGQPFSAMGATHRPLAARLNAPGNSGASGSRAVAPMTALPTRGAFTARPATIGTPAGRTAKAADFAVAPASVRRAPTRPGASATSPSPAIGTRTAYAFSPPSASGASAPLRRTAGSGAARAGSRAVADATTRTRATPSGFAVLAPGPQTSPARMLAGSVPGASSMTPAAGGNALKRVSPSRPGRGTSVARALPEAGYPPTRPHPLSAEKGRHESGLGRHPVVRVLAHHPDVSRVSPPVLQGAANLLPEPALGSRFPRRTLRVVVRLLKGIGAGVSAVSMPLLHLL
jgi:hypothetical protein